MATAATQFFASVWQTKHYVGPDKDNLYPVAGGIETAETDFDEDTDTAYYMDNEGGAETISKGASYPFNFEGHRKYGDPAQEFIRDKLVSSDKSCYFKVVEPDGRILEGPAKVSKITPFGGDTENRSTFKGTITFDGTPQDTKPVEVTSVSVSPASVSLAVGATQKVTATIEPDNASDTTVTFAVNDESVATVASDGTVTGVSAGSTQGIATASNGKFATFAITVTAS